MTYSITLNNSYKENYIPIFYHIPKTAGTNLTTVIRNNYQNTCNIDYNNCVCTEKTTNKIKCIFGHHSLKSIFVPGINPIIFVLLRHPVELVISRFAHNKLQNSMQHNLTLEEMFLNKPEIYFNKQNYPYNISKKAGFDGHALWASNVLCRTLYNTSHYGPEPYPLTQDICNKVMNRMKQNIIILKNFDSNILKTFPIIFGITEKFTYSLKLFAKCFDWKTIEYKEEHPIQAFSHEKRKYNVSKELEKAILKYNIFDLQIYNLGLEIFDKELKHFNIT